MSEYKNRVIIIVPTNAPHPDAGIPWIIWANQRAAMMDPDSGGENTFGSIHLSPDGLNPPTHTACSTRCKDETLAAVLGMAGPYPDVRVYHAEQMGWGEGGAFNRALEHSGLILTEPDAPEREVGAPEPVGRLRRWWDNTLAFFGFTVDREN